MNKMKPGELHAMMKKNPMKAYKSAIKMSGMFHGKSNALGHGGRAAQLKARGVPGGVIGNLARAAHAAPGQKNYHGKHAKKKKVAPLEKQELGMAMKHSYKKAAQHIHVHLHMKGSAGLVGQSEEHKELSGMNREKKSKHYKKARKGKFGDEKEQGLSKEHSEESADKFKKKESKHKCKGSACKHSSHKEKHSKKKA